MHWHPPDRSDHCFGPMVSVTFSLSDLTQPDTSFPVLGLIYITDDQPSSVCAYATNLSFGITNTPSMRQEKCGAAGNGKQGPAQSHLRQASVCTMTGPATAEAGPARSGARFCSIQANARRLASSALAKLLKTLIAVTVSSGA